MNKTKEIRKKLRRIDCTMGFSISTSGLDVFDLYIPKLEARFHVYMMNLEDHIISMTSQL